MKLSVWAKENGVSYRAALNWFHAGTLPVPARQLATGTILVDPPVTETGVVVAYGRVGSLDRKVDLERQAGRVLTTCSERGIRIDRTVTEIGSGRKPTEHQVEVFRSHCGAQRVATTGASRRCARAGRSAPRSGPTA